MSRFIVSLVRRSLRVRPQRPRAVGEDDGEVEVELSPCIHFSRSAAAGGTTEKMVRACRGLGSGSPSYSPSRQAGWGRSSKLVTVGLQFLLLFAGGLFAASCSAQDREHTESIVPVGEIIRPFNSRDLTGFTTWLEATKHKDPASDYRVTDGMIHIGGRGMGYLATVDSYKDYHLSVEYKWGKRSDGSKYVRNSGILLHATGPHGNARGIWMSSVECQLAQGCEGDIICIRGNDEDGKVIPLTLTSNTRIATDGRTRWLEDGEKTPYSGKQLWWANHEVGFEELLDTRGKDDVASPVGEWTTVECICDGNRITIKINGTVVNECYDVAPSAGKILLENEKNEIFFRNLEIRPLQRNPNEESK